MKKKFIVSEQDCTGKTIGTVNATDIDEAAHAAAKKFFSAHAACRVTGIHGKSGCFRIARSAERGTSTSLGEQFHIVEN